LFNAALRPPSRLDEQIVQQVEGSIHKGALKLGDQLPPERDLAEQFGVSRTVVREAVKAHGTRLKKSRRQE
jgi:GntR family transcriptional repressor for pyruvate dehydrogenase complex